MKPILRAFSMSMALVMVMACKQDVTSSPAASQKQAKSDADPQYDLAASADYRSTATRSSGLFENDLVDNENDEADEAGIIGRNGPSSPLVLPRNWDMVPINNVRLYDEDQIVSGCRSGVTLTVKLAYVGESLRMVGKGTITPFLENCRAALQVPAPEDFDVVPGRSNGDGASYLGSSSQRVITGLRELSLEIRDSRAAVTGAEKRVSAEIVRRFNGNITQTRVLKSEIEDEINPPAPEVDSLQVPAGTDELVLIPPGNVIWDYKENPRPICPPGAYCAMADLEAARRNGVAADERSLVYLPPSVTVVLDVVIPCGYQVGPVTYAVNNDNALEAVVNVTGFYYIDREKLAVIRCRMGGPRPTQRVKFNVRTWQPGKKVRVEVTSNLATQSRTSRRPIPGIGGQPIPEPPVFPGADRPGTAYFADPLKIED